MSAEHDTRYMRNDIVGLLLLHKHSDPLFTVTDVLRTIAKLHPFVEVDQKRLEQYDQQVQEVMARAEAELEVREEYERAMAMVIPPPVLNGFEAPEPPGIDADMDFDDPMEAE